MRQLAPSFYTGFWIPFITDLGLRLSCVLVRRIVDWVLAVEDVHTRFVHIGRLVVLIRW